MIFPHGLKSFFGYSAALTYLLTSAMRLKVSVYVKYHGYSHLQCAHGKFADEAQGAGTFKTRS